MADLLHSDVEQIEQALKWKVQIKKRKLFLLQNVLAVETLKSCVTANSHPNH
jgi:hypothetical protein